jgi:hypothetical protein
LFKAQRQDEINAGLSSEILSREGTVEKKDDDAASETSSTMMSGNRRASNRVEEMMRKEQDDKESEAVAYQAYASSKAGKAEIKSREGEGKKIDELERSLARKEHNLHQEFYLATAASDTNPIGHDRNYTKYFYFDAAAGAVSIMGGGFEEFMKVYATIFHYLVIQK